MTDEQKSIEEEAADYMLCFRHGMLVGVLEDIQACFAKVEARVMSQSDAPEWWETDLLKIYMILEKARKKLHRLVPDALTSSR